MILQPFDVVSRGTRYTFKDRNAIDSDEERETLFRIMAGQLALMQQDAMCAALGFAESGIVGNLELGVYDGSALIGVFLVTSLEYLSGPWADLTDWEVVRPNDTALFNGRPMPGFPPLSLAEHLDLSVASAHHLLKRDISTADGHKVRFSKLSWAIFKDRTDTNSVHAKRIHDHAKADNRLAMTELPDPANAARTRVDIELA